MHLIPFQAQSNKVGPWNSIESSLYCQKSPKLGLFYPKTYEKRAKLRSHITHIKNGRTHAHRTHTLKAFLHAHRTCANVRARVRVRIQFRNSQFAITLFQPGGWVDSAPTLQRWHQNFSQRCNRRGGPV